jgi:hypothetical protein
VRFDGVNCALSRGGSARYHRHRRALFGFGFFLHGIRSGVGFPRGFLLKSHWEFIAVLGDVS